MAKRYLVNVLDRSDNQVKLLSLSQDHMEAIIKLSYRTHSGVWSRFKNWIKKIKNWVIKILDDWKIPEL